MLGSRFLEIGIEASIEASQCIEASIEASQLKTDVDSGRDLVRQSRQF
jgi:hypothetical protein